jgi:hypothetical protein
VEAMANLEAAEAARKSKVSQRWRSAAKTAVMSEKLETAERTAKEATGRKVKAEKAAEEAAARAAEQVAAAEQAAAATAKQATGRKASVTWAVAAKHAEAAEQSAMAAEQAAAAQRAAATALATEADRRRAQLVDLDRRTRARLDAAERQAKERQAAAEMQAIRPRLLAARCHLACRPAASSGAVVPLPHPSSTSCARCITPGLLLPSPPLHVQRCHTLLCCDHCLLCSISFLRRDSPCSSHRICVHTHTPG